MPIIRSFEAYVDAVPRAQFEVSVAGLRAFHRARKLVLDEGSLEIRGVFRPYSWPLSTRTGFEVLHVAEGSGTALVVSIMPPDRVGADPLDTFRRQAELLRAAMVGGGAARSPELRTLPVSGWYYDRDGCWRWWDGRRWTDRIRQADSSPGRTPVLDPQTGLVERLQWWVPDYPETLRRWWGTVDDDTQEWLLTHLHDQRSPELANKVRELGRHAWNCRWYPVPDEYADTVPDIIYAFLRGIGYQTWYGRHRAASFT